MPMAPCGGGSSRVTARSSMTTMGGAAFGGWAEAAQAARATEMKRARRMSDSLGMPDRRGSVHRCHDWAESIRRIPHESGERGPEGPLPVDDQLLLSSV